MGVKSTVRLTRLEAEDKFVELYKKIKQPDNIIRAQAVAMTYSDLETVLETMNDQVNGGEGFENYLISYKGD